MVGVDTNVLVRILINDDPDQAAVARRWFERATASGGVAVDALTLSELVWVLRARYQQPKARMIAAIEQLLATAGVVCLFEDQIRAALAAWSNGPGDFADYLMRERYRVAGARRMVTFDRALAGLPGITVLP
jgi:predicted nucleic-acid-binding protein